MLKKVSSYRVTILRYVVVLLSTMQNYNVIVKMSVSRIRNKLSLLRIVVRCSVVGLLIFAVDLYRLDMQSDEGLVAEAFAKFALDVRGMLVGMIQADVARQTQMHGHSYVVADAAGAQMVYVGDARFLLYNLHYLVLNIVGKAMFQQFVKSLLKKSEGSADNKKADYHSSDGVEYCPLCAEKQCAAYAQSRAERRERVRAVMPGIRHNSLRPGLFASLDGEAVSPFLEDDAEDGGGKGNEAGARQRIADDRLIYLADAVAANGDADAKQAQADDGRGQRLVLAVTVIVVLVGRFARDAYKHYYDNVSKEVGKRMHRIRNHCRRMAQDTGHKLEYHEHGVNDAAHQRDTIYLPFATGVAFRIVVVFIDISHVVKYKT